MRLKELKKNYDVIVSLGSGCQPAYQLNKNSLRSFAGPFDWFVSGSLPNIGRLFKNKLNGFFEYGNIVELQLHDNFRVVKDTYYDCISYHDFPLSDNIDSITLKSYQKFKEKLDRRLNNLTKKINDGQNILFVRENGEYDDVLGVQQSLREFAHKEFDILVINHPQSNSDVVEEDWEIGGVCAVKVPHVDRWEGHDTSWKYILSFIDINIYMNTTFRKAKEDIFVQDQEVFFGKGYYSVERHPLPRRWVDQRSELFIKSHSNIKKEFKIGISSFHKKRQCSIILNGNEILNRMIDQGYEQVLSTKIQLLEGINELEIISSDASQSPSDLIKFGSSDTRKLSFLITFASVE